MPARRTQTERSTHTRAALVDATVLLLIERGWGATTSVAVCEVADVTRGALHHHYADMGELLADALMKLCAELAIGVSEPATSLLELVDKSWAVICDRRFKAVMEAWWAAGNDSGVARTVRPVMTAVARLVSPDRSSIAHARRAGVPAFMTVSREAMIGLAMGRATNSGRPLPHEKSTIAALRTQARELDRRFGA